MTAGIVDTKLLFSIAAALVLTPSKCGTKEAGIYLAQHKIREIFADSDVDGFSADSCAPVKLKLF